MKKIIALCLTVIVTMSFTACSVVTASATADDVAQEEADYTKDLMNQMTDEIGMPNITNFYEKKLAKEVFEKRDDSSLICYVYNQNLDGQYIYVGKSMGYGLPYSTQYTNPEMMGSLDGGQYNARAPYVISQADPNGLYSADGLSATWLMMIDEFTGENYIMYAEPTIVVTENKLPARLIAKWSLIGVDY